MTKSTILGKILALVISTQLTDIYCCFKHQNLQRSTTYTNTKRVNYTFSTTMVYALIKRQTYTKVRNNNNKKSIKIKNKNYGPNWRRVCIKRKLSNDFTIF